jgi:hypothetical protein
MIVPLLVIGTSALSALVPGMPTGTWLAMALGGMTALGAARLHRRADHLRAGGDMLAVPTLRLARFCDDLAVALCVLALLFGVHPF